jgi:hypothetical protein
MGDDTLKSPLVAKGSHVEFVDHIVSERPTQPGIIFPRELGIDYLGRAMDAFGLIPGSRIRAFLLAVQAVKILVAGIHALRDHIVVTALLLV